MTTSHEPPSNGGPRSAAAAATDAEATGGAPPGAADSSRKHKRTARFLLIGILVGTVAGALFGGVAPAWAREVDFLGGLFISLLKVMVVPLVITSMVVGITGIGDVRHLGSFGGRVILYFFCTTFMAVLVGMLLVNVIQPGRGYSHFVPAVFEAAGLTRATVDGEKVWQSADPAFADLAKKLTAGEVAEDRALVALTAGWAPDDPRFEALNRQLDNYVDKEDIAAAAKKRRDAAAVTGAPAPPPTAKAGFMDRVWLDRSNVASYQYTLKKITAAGGAAIDQAVQARTKTPEEGARELLKLREGDANAHPLNAIKQVIQSMVPTNIFRAATTDGSEMLALIVFGIFFGVVAVMLGPKAKPALDLVTSLNDIVMAMVHLVILTAPVGIFALVAGKIGSEGGFQGFMPLLEKLAWYAATVVAGLTVHGLVVLPLMLWIFGRRNPLQYLTQMSRALILAFTTASSSATLPMSIECAAVNAGISKRSREFVLPMGATINMDGTALYEAVAVLFIAQIYGLHLGVGQQIVLFLTATLAAIGAAGIPEAGLVTMVMVMAATGVPVEGMSFILVIDWILDRFRTTVNVWGDLCGAAIMDKVAPEDTPAAGAVVAAPEVLLAERVE